MSIEILNESNFDVDEASLMRVARHVLDAMGVSPLAELSILVADVELMTELHVQYMNEPGPTDVLAFPMDELDLRGSRGAGHGHEEGPDEQGPMMLGDVILCPPFIEEQAVEAGHSTDDELQLLTTHGVLHLLGFDHHEPEEHAEMFGLQAKLLASWKASRGA
ncbi:MAG: hypothetical protein JWM02_3232 [Frankiales bacterium]|nr:hypothetical protein [Frankiales bacterium]